MNAERAERHWTRTDTLRVIGSSVIGAALTVPELTGLVPHQSLGGRLMEVGAIFTFGQAAFPPLRVARII
jgi:hypothetical protein